jgi:hypothetical protein
MKSAKPEASKAVYSPKPDPRREHLRQHHEAGQQAAPGGMVHERLGHLPLGAVAEERRRGEDAGPQSMP